MEITKRITDIINYPEWVDNVDMTTWYSPIGYAKLVYLSSKPVDNECSKIWLQKDGNGKIVNNNIFPLEGYFIGYGSLKYYDKKDDRRKLSNFASILNLPEFIYDFYNLISSTDSTADVYNLSTYYYFLNALPLNPPYPELTPKKGNTKLPDIDDNNRLNPALLFKSSVGIYSLPETYIHWLGGMWSILSKGALYNRLNSYPINPFIRAKFNNAEFGSFTNFNENNSIDYNDIFQRIRINNVDTVGINMNNFIKPEIPSFITLFVEGDNNGNYEINNLNGFGYNNLLFNELYKKFHKIDIHNLDSDLNNYRYVKNTITKLRTFTSCSYDIGQDKNISTLATYSILKYSEDPPNEIRPPTANDINVFSVYSSIWKFLYWNIKGGKNYDDLVNNIIQAYDANKDAQKCLFNLNNYLGDEFLFTLTDGTIGVAKANVNSNDFTKKYNLFSDDRYKNSNSYYIIIDYIAYLVYRFIASDEDEKNVEPDLLSFNLTTNDHSHVFCLYPSAGGTVGLQYSLKDIHEIINKETGISTNEILVRTFFNYVLNSAKMIWYTGPFIGTLPYNTATTGKDDSKENYKIINENLLKFSNTLFLDKLKDRFLFNKTEFDGKHLYKDITIEYRTHFLWSDYNNIVLEETSETIGGDDGVKTTSQVTKKLDVNNEVVMKYSDVVDYVGTQLLDNFKLIFESLDKNDTINLMLSLMVVDEGDFSDIQLNQPTKDSQTVLKFTAQEQLDLLLHYNIILSNGYAKGNIFGVNRPVDAHKVMNAALTNAQYNKVKRVIEKKLFERKLVNVGSTYDFISVKDEATGKVLENNFDSSVFSDIKVGKTVIGELIRKSIFGNQAVLPWSGGFGSDAINAVNIYVGKGKIPTDKLRQITEFFFSDNSGKGINVHPTVQTVKLCKDALVLYVNQFTSAEITGNLTNKILYEKLVKVGKIYEERYTNYETHINYCLEIFKRTLEDKVNEINDAVAKVVLENKNPNSDINRIKTKTYYNIKSIYDNWLTVDPEVSGKINLSYLTNGISTFFDHFMFVDRSMRSDNVGNDLLTNVSWLKDFFENNFGYDGNSKNISIYTFLSSMAQQHGALIHAMPSFINMGNVNVDSANQLFGIYDTADLIDNASPKFIFQFIGNISSILNNDQNNDLRSFAKSYSLSEENLNVTNKVEVPEDMRSEGSRPVSFIVNFGAQEQQMFSNLILDQNEFQNTEEYYQLIVNQNNKPQTQSVDLFSIYTSRSYTATIDSLGNMMIQPLMYFDLVNIPLFYGTYWITNVKHTITPNNIKTTFKGVRQPVSVLPSKGDVLLQIANENMKNYLGVTPDNVITTKVKLDRLPCGSYNDRVLIKEAERLSTKGDDTMSSNQKIVAKYFKDKGYNKSVVAGIMGNIQKESSFNPNAYNGNDAKNSTDYGIIQWNSVHKDELPFWKDKPATLQAQLRYLTTQYNDFNKFNNTYPVYNNDDFKKDTAIGATYMAYLFACITEICVNCINGYVNYTQTEPYHRSMFAVDFFYRFNDKNDSLYWEGLS